VREPVSARNQAAARRRAGAGGLDGPEPRHACREAAPASRAARAVQGDLADRTGRREE